MGIAGEDATSFDRVLLRNAMAAIPLMQFASNLAMLQPVQRYAFCPIRRQRRIQVLRAEEMVKAHVALLNLKAHRFVEGTSRRGGNVVMFRACFRSTTN